MSDTNAVHEWQPIETAPDDIEVETKIDSHGSVRNVTTLRRQGRLWFFPNYSMYVYYTPTHWRPAPPESPSKPEQK